VRGEKNMQNEKITCGAVGSIEDNKSRVHHFNEAVKGYVITNDGETDLKINLLGETFTVKAGEQFEEIFTPFSAVEIDTLNQTVDYRAYGRR
jgi:hypothetical protein